MIGMRLLIWVSLLACCSVQLSYADSGVRGRVAWRGELVPEIKVRAYRTVADIAEDRVVAVSAPTDLDGTYHLDLAPGSYVLTARSGSGDLVPGDYFCYYSGSPVQVPVKGYRNVGFNLVRVPEEATVQTSKRSGIQGVLTYRDEPLEKSYLYVYKSADRHFKGPGYFIQPVARGEFRLSLPPGEYYLLARKRERGGQFGPIETGDFFNYYYGNPIQIGAGEMHTVNIETVTRQSMLEEDIVDFQGVRGHILDAAGTPLSGLYVFAYRSPDMTGTPDYFSGPTGPDGRFEISLPDNSPYYLLARQAFGGPAGAQELYGKLEADNGTPLAVSINEKEVVIHVAPKESL